jgi:hypothetical protein
VSPPPARLASGNNPWVAHWFNVWRSSEDVTVEQFWQCSQLICMVDRKVHGKAEPENTCLC